MAARRAQQAKQSLASSSNLSTLTSGASTASSTYKLAQSRARIKSTSMTNLVAANSTQNLSSQQNFNKIHRPASRNALDSIHKGMNAKFTHVQSKVLLQNIRPQQQPQASSSKIPAKAPPERLMPATPSSTLRRTTPSSTPSPSGKIQQSDRSQLINRIKSLQDELERHERRNDELKQELERERTDKAEQVQQAKLELQERAAESERQADEYHQKLLEAYELADANRRAADTVLSESRQREDELRKKIDELEQQLVELREFVAMKDEMSSKMSELREQIRNERERYEEKTRTLHQMFENEKIRTMPNSQKQSRSNYFGRAKASLQSVESINRLEAGGELQSGSNRSHDDLYGSRMSTRMQDGAKLAWKRSRKFASSVITGGLAGLSACRKHNMGGPQQTAANSNGAANLRPASGAASCQATACGSGEEHTSVVEVGSTVADFVAHQSPQQGEPVHSHEQQHGLIRVDANNKLTIVTKFSDSSSSRAQEHHELQQQQQQLPQAQLKGSPDSSGRSSSERSRCESSSSGRGTGSDSCGSQAGSQNGDVAPTGDVTPSATNATKHKRKASLFKANALGGSQASLNKTLKSFFALASAKAASQTLSTPSPARSIGEPAEPMTAGQRQFVEFQQQQRQQQVFDETANASLTPSSSLVSSPLENGERTPSDEVKPETNSTTAQILDELVRYAEPETNNNNHDGGQPERKRGQGEQQQQQPVDGQRLATALEGHRQQVAVEH